MRIAVITSRTAEPVIREVVSRSKAVAEGTVRVEVVPLPVPAIGILNADIVARIALRLSERLQGYDVILVPGTVEGDVSSLSSLTGSRVYKASRDPGLLPRIIDYIAGGGTLDTVKPAEDLLSLDEPGLEPGEVAYEVEGLKVPVRGPPLLIMAEVAPGISGPDTEAAAKRMEREGAHLLVVGATWDMEGYRRRVSSIVDSSSIPVLAEAPSPTMARVAVESGAVGVSVSAVGVEEYIGILPKDRLVVVGERDLSLLERAVRVLQKAGYEKIAADPVVGLPLIDYSSTPERYRRAVDLGIPLVFSAANAASALDADTHGVYALLASMAVELSASFFLVVEDTYKTIHSVAEAREALRLAYRAWSRRIQPHGLGSRLLVVKQLEPPPKPTMPAEDYRMVEEWVEPVMEEGYFRIEVDHRRGLILVEYSRGGIRRRYAGRRARSLARVISRELEISREHAAYLGEELAKAELALRTGRTYIQDEEVLRMVWED